MEENFLVNLSDQRTANCGRKKNIVIVNNHGWRMLLLPTLSVTLITMEILYKLVGDGAKGTYINIVIAQRTVEVCYHLLVPLTTQTLRLRSVCLDYFKVSHQRYSKCADVRKILALTPRQINRSNAVDSHTATTAPFIGLWYS